MLPVRSSLRWRCVESPVRSPDEAVSTLDRNFPKLSACSLYRIVSVSMRRPARPSASPGARRLVGPKVSDSRPSPAPVALAARGASRLAVPESPEPLSSGGGATRLAKETRGVSLCGPCILRDGATMPRSSSPL